MDLSRIRAQFPALDHGVAHFDGPGGSQTPRCVAEAVAGALTAGLANRGTVTEAERRAEEITVGARAAMADLLGADPGGIVFGRSMTQITFDVARTLAQGWGPGDEVVVTRLDHDANIRPWVIAAERAGATVRWLGFDPETAELDDVSTVLSDRTRLVAVTAASNLLGTRPDVPAITQGRMLASWSSRVTTTSSPGPQPWAKVRARSKVICVIERPNTIPPGSAPSRSAIAARAPTVTSSARRSASVTVPRLARPAVRVRATASATDCGVCEPPGPSKWATPRSSAGNWARMRVRSTRATVASAEE